MHSEILVHICTDSKYSAIQIWFDSPWLKSWRVIFDTRYFIVQIDTLGCMPCIQSKMYLHWNSTTSKKPVQIPLCSLRLQIGTVFNLLEYSCTWDSPIDKSNKKVAATCRVQNVFSLKRKVLHWQEGRSGHSKAEWPLRPPNGSSPASLASHYPQNKLEVKMSGV